jgi:hypothetical protein
MDEPGVGALLVGEMRDGPCGLCGDLRSHRCAYLEPGVPPCRFASRTTDTLVGQVLLA